jgi:hypothetical protein
VIPNNLGKHIYAIPVEQRDRKEENLQIGIFIFQQSWALGIFSVKSSILYLYWRLFRKNNAVRYQLMFWTVIVVCWFIEYVWHSCPNHAVPRR